MYLVDHSLSVTPQLHRSISSPLTPLDVRSLPIILRHRSFSPLHDCQCSHSCSSVRYSTSCSLRLQGTLTCSLPKPTNYLIQVNCVCLNTRFRPRLFASYTNHPSLTLFGWCWVVDYVSRSKGRLAAGPWSFCGRTNYPLGKKTPRPRLNSQYAVIANFVHFVDLTPTRSAKLSCPSDSDHHDSRRSFRG